MTANSDIVQQPHHDIIINRLVKYGSSSSVRTVLIHRSILSPIKAFRAQQPVSKGKKSKKRKRSSGPKAETPPAPESDPSSKATLQSPVILQHTLLGFNHVTRHLEALSVLSRPPHYETCKTEPGKQTESTASTKKQHVAAVFLLHPFDDLIYAHLPTLCHTASLADPDQPATRLVLLDPVVEKRIAEAVGLPRVSVVGVSDLQSEEDDEATAGVAGLIQYVREHVETVEVPWLRDAKEGKWLGTRIETSTG